MRKHRALELLFIVVVAVAIWWLLQPAHKAVHGDVELGEPTVTTSDPGTQAGSSDYYTSSTPGDFS